MCGAASNFKGLSAPLLPHHPDRDTRPLLLLHGDCMDDLWGYEDPEPDHFTDSSGALASLAPAAALPPTRRRLLRSAGS